MQKKIIRILFVFITGVFALYACTSDFIVPDMPSPDVPISYSGEIQPIFNSGCGVSGCHLPGIVEPDLSAANSYNSLMAGNYIDTLNPNQSNIYKVMASGGSMSSFCTTADANKVLTWIQQGAKNN